MKIRKLIFSAKLEQIEQQNQNIFIFHCIPNAAQWRFLKNFLFFSGRIAKDSNEYRNPAGSTMISAFPIREQRLRSGSKNASELMHFRVLEDHPLDSKVGDRALAAIPSDKSSERGEINSPSLARLGSSEKSLRGYTFFQSTTFKKRLAQFPLENKYAASSFLPQKRQENPWDSAVDPMEKYLASKIKTGTKTNPRKRFPIEGGPRGTNDLLPVQAPQATKSSKKNFRPKGCLFFFDTRSHTVIETHQKCLTALELVNKIESLELNNNLILLFGQMNSTAVNHVDLKEASILSVIAIHQQFFLSMHSLSFDLNFCLHQKIDEFICIQERRKG
jgi:hypothetical protein